MNLGQNEENFQHLCEFIWFLYCPFRNNVIAIVGVRPTQRFTLSKQMFVNYIKCIEMTANTKRTAIHPFFF